MNPSNSVWSTIYLTNWRPSPDQVGGRPHARDIILSVISSFYSYNSTFPLLDSWDNFTKAPFINLTCLLQYTFWRYSSAKWDNLCNVLARYGVNACCYNSDVPVSISIFSDIILQTMDFSAHFRIRQATFPLVAQSRKYTVLFAGRTQHFAVPYYRFVHVKNKRWLAIPRAKKRPVHCKAERLLSNANRSWTFWPLAKAIPKNFSPSNFLLRTNNFGNQTNKLRFLSSSPIFPLNLLYNLLLFQLTMFLHLLSPEKFIKRPFLDVRKPPDLDGSLLSVLKMCPWVDPFYPVFPAFPSIFLFQCSGYRQKFPLHSNAMIYLTQTTTARFI